MTQHIIHIIKSTKVSLAPWLIILLLLTNSTPAISADTNEGFDHFTTGFPLTGRHELTECSGCHLAGQFKGTPMECTLCHNNSRAPGKHPQHIMSSNICDDCHTTYSWRGARFDHSDVIGSCDSCHNNSIDP